MENYRISESCSIAPLNEHRADSLHVRTSVERLILVFLKEAPKLISSLNDCLDSFGYPSAPDCTEIETKLSRVSRDEGLVDEEGEVPILCIRPSRTGRTWSTPTIVPLYPFL
eukprot:TRINITY_DN8681_c0_g1_i5.p1 TRINITY_DN8681_c0_g1~~TRINITY_DN8681_c0_g1_i5.p1  ORF type:complete len:112 (+),score=7.92 TRINITY_DN8681_c0_g1_i5:182-517(+)